MDKRTIVVLCLCIFVVLNIFLGAYFLGGDYTIVEVENCSCRKEPKRKPKPIEHTSSGFSSISSNAPAEYEESKPKVEDNRKLVNIVFASDYKYGYPTLVSICSIAKNSDPSVMYNITILHQPTLPKDVQELLKGMGNVFPNVNVTLVDMGDSFSNYPSTRYSHAMYYRLKLGNILSDVKICLYLDGDVIVRKNLTRLFEKDMTGYYIAGVRDYNQLEIYEGSKYYQKIGIPDLKTYVSSGVLLMNLEEIRNNNMTAILLADMPNTKYYLFPDQDVINRAFYGHIQLFSCDEVVVAHILNRVDQYSHWIGMDVAEFKELSKDPIIFHFTGKKPWVEVVNSYGDEWWQLVDETPYKDVIRSAYGK